MHGSIEQSSPTENTLVHLAGLRKPNTVLGRMANRISDLSAYHATRKSRKAGVHVLLRMIDYRPEAPSVTDQREMLQGELQTLIDGGSTVVVVGSSAGGSEALRLANELGTRGIAIQARLRPGGKGHAPTMQDAARNHPQFIDALKGFERDVAPVLAENPDNYLTIGAKKDSVVPRALKETPKVRHVEVAPPKGLLGQIPGLDHMVAIHQGLRHPAVQEHIKG